MNKAYTVLVKREFWENRSLWIAPAAAAAFLVGVTLVGAMIAPGHVRFDGVDVNTNIPSDLTRSPDRVMMMSVVAMASVIVLVASFVVSNYLLDCLFNERKDRSILFWKSLPVSDRDTVLSKFAVAMVVVPAGVFALQAVTSLLIAGIVAMASGGAPDWLVSWHFTDWIRAQAMIAGIAVVALLWFAPVAAWLMLASVISRRAPLMIATMPWVILTASERIMLGTTEVWKFLGRRLMPSLSPLERLADPAMWIGLAAAAGMLYMVIRLRRYRDDT